MKHRLKTTICFCSEDDADVVTIQTPVNRNSQVTHRHF